MVTHFIFKMFYNYGIISKFDLSAACVSQFSTLIQQGYNSKNPYHNSLHAIDVTHRLNYLI